MFPKPRPSDLITVPSCLDCNKSFEKDDEYFKHHLGIRGDIESHPAAESLLQELRRAWRRPQGVGLTAFVRSTLAKRPRSGQSGPGPFELGQVPDNERINRVLARTIRGLFYHETRTLIPFAYSVAAVPAELADPEFQIGFEVLLFKAPDRVVAGGDFVYSFLAAADDPFATSWLLQFYDSALFYGVSAPPRVAV